METVGSCGIDGGVGRGRCMRRPPYKFFDQVHPGLQIQVFIPYHSGSGRSILVFLEYLVGAFWEAMVDDGAGLALVGA